MSKQIYKKSDKLLLLIPTVFLFFSLGIIPTVVIITACIHFITVVCIAVFTCKAGITAVIGIEVLRICIVISVVILRIVLIIICVALVIVVSVRIAVLSVKIIWIYSAVRIIICVVTVVRLRSVIVWELCIGINICLILFYNIANFNIIGNIGNSKIIRMSAIRTNSGVMMTFGNNIAYSEPLVKNTSIYTCERSVKGLKLYCLEKQPFVL